MNKALVTGGAGFLGSSIVRELLDRNVAVRVFALPNEPTENLGGLDVEVVRGNVLDIPSVKRAVDGVDAVFHAAAVYKDFMPDPTPMYDANLRGTFNVLEASRRAGVAKVVYTASIVSLGRPRPGDLGDENTPYDGWGIDFAYGRSKYHSRILAEDFANWGFDVRVVCPGVVLGPRDIAPTPSGKIIVNAARRRSPSTPTVARATWTFATRRPCTCSPPKRENAASDTSPRSTTFRIEISWSMSFAHSEKSRGSPRCRMPSRDRQCARSSNGRSA
jgi:dihydroflavonol-4-reductase